MSFRRGLLIVLAAFCVALLAWIATRVPDRHESVAAFTLPGLQGPSMTLPVAGRMTLINYWASWCGPCREELPLLASFSRQQGPDGVRVVAIALDERRAAEEFLHTRGADLSSLIETPGPGDSSVRLGNDRSVLPFTVLIGRDGRLQKRRFGAFRDANDLRDWAASP